jgi:transposase
MVGRSAPRQTEVGILIGRIRSLIVKNHDDRHSWLGVVPGEHSTGGKQTLTDTKRRGNRYLRKLFVQGAHAVLQQRMKQSNGLNTWLAQLTSRERIQVAAVALANKMARMVWAVLSKGEAYRPPLLIETAGV